MATVLPPDATLEYTLQLQEWLKREWLTYPAMLMEGALPNFFTINVGPGQRYDVIWKARRPGKWRPLPHPASHDEQQRRARWRRRSRDGLGREVDLR